MGQEDGEIMQLIHHLLKTQDFQHCAYCGKDFVDVDKPQLSRYGEREYITLSCSNGHEHSISIDINRALDAKLLHKEIQNRKVPVPETNHTLVNIEDTLEKKQ